MVTFPVPISLSLLFLFVKQYIHVYYTVAINKAKLVCFSSYLCLFLMCVVGRVGMSA